MRFKRIILLILLALPEILIYGQYYETGQDPASVRWLQVKTDRFRVIFPESYGQEGILFARSLDESFGQLRKVFPDKKFRIPVIIHSYSTESNGYVAWAPKRMEIYPAPDQSSIPLGTRTQLTLHELTHVFQMASLNKGFSKAASFFLGEQFTGLTAAMLPLWYFEGKAVFTESALTASGRGRSPYFLREFRAISLENGKKFKYDRIVNGSFREYVPNHYFSGYQIVTYSFAKNGLDFWNNNLDYTAKYPFLADPVNISMLRQAGITKRKLYEETYDTLALLWTKELSEKKTDSFIPLNKSKKGEYVNYYSPVVIGRDSILSIKTSLRDPAGFVLTDTRNKTEKRIHTGGQIYPFHLSYGGGKTAWVEYKPDPRWENRNYMIIKTMDLRTGIVRILSEKSRYLSAAISPDGTRIAAFENSVSNKNSLVIIDAYSGIVISSVSSPENAALQRPAWSTDGEKITVISLTDKGEAVLSYSLKQNTWTTLVSYGRNDLQSAVLRNDSLFYISSGTGSEELHLITPSGKKVCLTISKYGINDISADERNLVFSNYTSGGFEICSMPAKDIRTVLNPPEDSASYLINRFEISDDKPEDNDISAYKTEAYKKHLHLFSFHSWMPFYADIEQVKDDPASIRPGITLLSQNQLSTLTTEAGYEYSVNKEHILHSKIIWKGWYPVIESGISYGGNPGILTGGEKVTSPSGSQNSIHWINIISLPLRYASGRFSQYIQPSVTYDYRNNYIWIPEEKSFDNSQGLLSGRFYFSNSHRSSVRDIYPRWAQVFDLNYTFAPYNTDIYPGDISLKTALYTPGIFPNNGLKLRFEREKQQNARYSLSNRISLPRGYKNILSKDLTFLSADYTFPLAYPDLNISSLLYLKRFRAVLFGDYASASDNYYLKKNGSGLTFDYRHDYREAFSSFGVEMLADFHILRLPFMISGGVQSAWKNINEAPVFEILFNIELFGMAINRENKL